MKRKHRKTVNYFTPLPHKETAKFPKGAASLWLYNQANYRVIDVEDLAPLQFKNYPDEVFWLNIYGLQHQQAIRQIVTQNKLDEFILNLTAEGNHRNKVIELENCFFFSLKAPVVKREGCTVLAFEQLFFVVSKADEYVWTIQEQEGDHFDHIRERISKNVGIIRKKSADYLFYLLIEAIIDHYYIAYEHLSEENKRFKDFENVRATAEFATQVEHNRRELFRIKHIASALRDALMRLEALEFPNFNPKYLIELKEQISYLNDAIDHSEQQLESSINLIINIQSNRLNEVMRTLTVLSVIFIPLTFIAGIYGMNFDNMPELHTENGYFVILGIMLLVAMLTLYYFKRQKWFD